MNGPPANNHLDEEDGVAELIEKCLLGSSAAMSALVSRYQNALDRWFRFSCACSPEDAEDLTQETLLEAIRSLPRYDRQLGTFRPWIFGVAYKKLLQWKRSAARGRGALEDVGARQHRLWEQYLRDQERTHEESLEVQEMWRAFSALSDADRLLLYFRHIDVLPLEAIARIVGVSMTTLRMRFSRANRRLRKLLEKCRRI